MTPHSPKSVPAGSYYEVLGIAFDASEEDIRKQYHSIVRTLHPDKRRPTSRGNELLDRFHQVQSAHRCLSDPTRRLIYDLRNFGTSSTEGGGEAGGIISDAAEAKVIRLQKEQAMRDISNMEVIHDKVLRRERAKRGVLLRHGLYGDLRLRADRMDECLRGSRTIEVEDLIGSVCDVTVPLQCLVEQHKIVLTGGAHASKADIPGFYNPSPLESDLELSLYVRYEFKGRLHEVTVGDHETLEVPMRKHLIPAGHAPRGPFSGANVQLLRPNGPNGRASATLGTTIAESVAISAGFCSANTPQQILLASAEAYKMHALVVRSPDEASPKEFVVLVAAAILCIGMLIKLQGRSASLLLDTPTNP